MRSLFAVAVLSTLSFGCVSTKADESAMPEGADPVADIKGAQEPCPAPLVTPDAENKKAEESADASAPAVVAEEKPLEETDPVKLEGAAPDAAQEPTPPPADPAPVAVEGDQPDARSHIDVSAVPEEIPDRRDYYVTTSGLNVRAEPSAQSAVVRQLRKGEKVTSYGREGIWVQIAENEYVSIIYLSDRQVPAQAGNVAK